MDVEQKQSADPGGNTSEKEKPLKPEEEESEECRCKEVSKKRFPELLRLLLKDLAFWRKKDS
ncbi:MAG: hypothetical protein A3J81_08550 [Nitrospirae bacterium RIFOXYB2_FULL_43_5]|nr:MAG: hypothetical protein A2X54_06050 [Nitrospirae bacterium GWF2_44_13]OGW66215.1 MAG: hypothetical protein A2222_07765 [Nitrospirae bacterium RIFOXYA2_FULL_44_9]OGW76217.1 MAG: hypothetical protein A3J81_08550 [Nitrospirae bacterium RIFOXYB2_FULL_43_5]HBG93659.1 hypothetical protein [Nitrospiraceae bacterium]HBU06293.1 hypothetical protein [Nitrospiraceae bacterium]